MRTTGGNGRDTIGGGGSETTGSDGAAAGGGSADDTIVGASELQCWAAVIRTTSP